MGYSCEWLLEMRAPALEQTKGTRHIHDFLAPSDQENVLENKDGRENESPPSSTANGTRCSSAWLPKRTGICQFHGTNSENPEPAPPHPYFPVQEEKNTTAILPFQGLLETEVAEAGAFEECTFRLGRKSPGS